MDTDAAAQLPPELLRAHAAHEEALRIQTPAAIAHALAAWRDVLAVPAIQASPWAVAMSFNHAGALLLEYYQATGDADALTQGVDAQQTAVDGLGADPAHGPRVLLALGRALLERYRLDEREEDLERAEAAFAAARGHGALPDDALAELAIALRLRAQREKTPEAFDGAVALAREAGTGYEALLILGNALLARAKAAGSDADLDEAIAVYARALELVQPDDRNRSLTLNNLASALLQRGRAEDIDTAIAHLEEALFRDPERVTYARLEMLQNLSEALSKQRELTGDAPVELEERTADALVAELARAGERPRSRAAAAVVEAVHKRYRRLGEVEDLDEAIEALDVGDFAHRSPADLTLLASLLRARYERRGDLDDLDRAIRMYEAALERATERPPVLANLAVVLRDRYRHTRAREDLRRALDAATEATEAADEPSYHVTLGQVLLTLYERTDDEDDLDAALEHLGTAVGATPHDASERDGYLNSYAVALLDRFRATGDLASCVEAVEALHEIVEGTPATSANLPGYLSNYAGALQTRYEATGDEGYRRESEGAYRRAVELPQVATDAVVEIAARWGHAAMAREDWDEAAAAYRHGVQAADRLFRTQSSRAHREAWLRTTSRLPADAAYTLVRAAGAQDAVTVLEGGRAALLSEALELRQADVEQLRQGHEALADRFVRAANRVVALDTQPTGETG